jgi:hypothetical protein
MRHESFLAWVSRVGISAAARKAGVTEATVRRWQRAGVSARAAPQLDRIVKRHEAARKGRGAQIAHGDFAEAARERFTLPPKQRYVPGQGFEELTPEQLLPRKAPLADKRVRGALKRNVRASWIDYADDRWVGKTSPFRMVDQNYLEFDDRVIGAQILDDLVGEPPDTMVRLFILCAYYYPDNPNYKAQRLIRKKGTWKPFWVSTGYREAAAADRWAPGIARGVLRTASAVSEDGGFTRSYYGSVDDQSQERTIWIVGWQTRYIRERNPEPRTRRGRR